MEEKDEFSDILLEQDSGSKSSKFKKITLVVGIFILIFLIVLLVMKFLNKPETANDGSKLVIEPEKTVVETPETEKKDDPMFKQVPIVQEDSKKDNFDELVKKLKEKENKRAQEALEESKKVEQVVPEAEPVKEVKQEVKQVPITEVKSITKPKVTKPKKPKPTPVRKITPKPKKIPSIPSPKASASSSIPSGIYIQVSASSKSKPDARFIAKLKAKGYPYQLFRTTVKGTKYLKVLVGPYSTSTEARAKMVGVKKDLNPKAFVFRVK